VVTRIRRGGERRQLEIARDDSGIRSGEGSGRVGTRGGASGGHPDQGPPRGPSCHQERSPWRQASGGLGDPGRQRDVTAARKSSDFLVFERLFSCSAFL